VDWTQRIGLLLSVGCLYSPLHNFIRPAGSVLLQKAHPKAKVQLSQSRS
jgi:hypothetical protein